MPGQRAAQESICHNPTSPKESIQAKPAIFARCDGDIRDCISIIFAAARQGLGGRGAVCIMSVVMSRYFRKNLTIRHGPPVVTANTLHGPIHRFRVKRWQI